MTMPHERARSMRWGHEFLQEVCEDALVTSSVRAEAAELQRSYPSPALVLEWINEDVSCIPVEAALSFERTAELLAFIVRSYACSDQLRRSAVVTSRHFPLPGEAQGWTVAVRGFSIQQWILPEDYYK